MKLNKYWFVPKNYGYGLVPISIEGWIATLVLIGFGLFIAYINGFFTPETLTFGNSFLFLAEILILGFAFLKIFEKRCKGKIKWNWGSR